MDDRLIEAPAPKERFVRKAGLEYYTTGENHDYLSDEILLLTAREEADALRTADDLFAILRKTARRCLDSPERLRAMHIPDRALPLLKWSAQEEWGDYLFGRFDFAGGMDGLPLQLLEFNADTCSLLPETTVLQPELIRRSRARPLTNRLADSLTDHLKQLKKARGRATGVATHLGHDDDHLNLDVISKAARKAGWDVDDTDLPSLIFDEENGLLRELGEDNYKRYYYIFKFFPWDWILQEEPRLWELLEKMSKLHLVRVINPAWTMLLQNKALMVFAWQDNPGHPALLPTAFDPADLPDPLAGYVRKPIYGRMGENVMISLNGRGKDAESRGDYADSPTVYQQLAGFGMDDEDYRYQLSTFQSPKTSAVCCRRQDDLILGDDAEFVPLGLLK